MTPCHHDFGDGRSVAKARTIKIRSGDEDFWFQHPVHGQDVDVAAISLDIGPETFTVDDARETADMRIEIGQDAFILGYPLEPVLTKMLPIWKRGTIATGSDFNFNGLASFLVDTATHDGISGGLVVTRSAGGYRGKSPSIVSGGLFFCRIGIYSGRLGANDDGLVQLGPV